MTEPDDPALDLPDDVDELRRQVTRALRRADRERAARLESERIAEESLSRLYEANEAKSTFLAMVSHELRTPLTSIMGFASLLRSSWDALDDERRLDFIERIDRNGRSLHDMIEEILEFSRLESETLTGRLKQDSLAVAVEDALARHAAMFERHELAVDLTPVDVTLERDAVARVLRNLVSNATRYSEPGTTVTVRVRDIDGGGVLEVIDEGPGIPPEDRELAFEPFFRGSHPHVIAVRGSGIGLTVCQRFAQMMGARISLGDAEPHGTTVAVEFVRSG